MSSIAQKTLPPAYEQSSQFRHWRFSPAQIYEFRKTHSEKAAQKYNNKEDIPSITVEEQVIFCRFYELQLQSICRQLKFSPAVMATAVIFFKRFFLYNTVLEYYPKDILLTCLFLATKSENKRMSLEEYGESVKINSTEVVEELEYTVSQALRFEYYIHHPYRPAYGFYLDMQSEVDLKLLQKTYDMVPAKIADILLTDLPLIYQPSQLALAAFAEAAKKTGFLPQLEAYIESRHSAYAKSLWDIIQQVTDVLSKVEPVTIKQATEIDARVKTLKKAAEAAGVPAKRPSSRADNVRDSKKHRRRDQFDSDENSSSGEEESQDEEGSQDEDAEKKTEKKEQGSGDQ